MVAKRRPRATVQFMLLLDKDDRRALLEVAAHEKLTLSDTVRRMIRSEHQRVQDAQRKTAVA